MCIFRKSIVMLITGLAIFLTLACSGDKKQSETTQDISVATDSVASDDGVMIYYDVRGEGSPALVFVHCWSCDRTYWRNQINEFAKNYTVVTIDLAGHGQSGQNRKLWAIKYYADDVAAVINKLGLDDIILIGHSMGGPVNIYAASLLQDKVKALIGVDCYQSFAAAYTPEQIAAFMFSFREDFKPSARTFIAGMFPPTADSTLKQEIVTDITSAPQDIAVNSLENLFYFMFTGGMTAMVKELNIPIRAIVSDQNPVDIDGNRMLVPSFDVKVMKGVGHFLHLEKPDEFNRLLRETINELTSGQTKTYSP